MTNLDDLTRELAQAKPPDRVQLLDHARLHIHDEAWTPDTSDPPFLLVTETPPILNPDPPDQGRQAWWKDQEKSVIVSLDDLNETDDAYKLGATAWKHNVDPVRTQLQGTPLDGEENFPVTLADELVREATTTVLRIETGVLDPDTLEQPGGEHA